METTAKKTVDYLEFTNKGEVPINAFKLLGASSKRDDATKIGFFGTGLKYALAVLLREGIGFKVYSGAKEVKIGTRKTKFYDREITVITVNGEKTSITVEAGINWEPWFAIREIYSNNLDENGQMKLSASLEPEAGYTKFYIERDEKLDGFIKNWSSYFSNTRTVISETEGLGVLEKNNNQHLTVFRRGIQAYTNRTPSVFDYDIEELAINESRVAMHDHQARQRCAEALALCDNVEAITKFVNCDSNYYEKDSNFWTYLFDEFNLKVKGFSNAWLTVLQDKRIVPEDHAGFYGLTSNSAILPDKLCSQLHKHFGDKLNIAGTTKEAYIILDNVSTDFLVPAMETLETVGFGYPINKVSIVRFKDEDIYGMADKDNVLISEKLTTVAFENDILSTLFEEVAHAKSGYNDNTRAFQNYIIKITCALAKAVAKKKA